MNKEKIILAEMRSSGVRGLLIYCADYTCAHYIAISGDRWPDDVRLSDLEPRFICSACGKRVADVRPDFHWDKPGGADEGLLIDSRLQMTLPHPHSKTRYVSLVRMSRMAPAR